MRQTEKDEADRKLLWQKAYETLEVLRGTSFGPGEGLLREELHSRNYHTGMSSGMVHQVRENAEWLPLLLSTGSPKDRELALQILKKVLKEQDRDPLSRTYGIWPYLFEEPLERMKNPDWNWAAFIGRVLITLEEEFKAEIPDELREEMKEALLCACESIERRNMGVDYTNISLMTSFVLVKTGELYGENYYYAKGVRNLERQLDFVEKNGGFCEYNSPTYGVIDIEETGRMLRYFWSEDARTLAEKLHTKCWEVFAHHYHVKTGQIAPPHTRCYEDIQPEKIRSAIFFGTRGRLVFREEEPEANVLWPFIDMRCPEELVGYFAEEGAARTVEEHFYKGYDPISNGETRVLIEKGIPSLTAVTYLHPDYCVGTFRKHDMWNQRRPMMAYLEGSDGTVCFRARCLHDDMDFASAIHTAMQDEGRVAGGISFVTDHGDYHYILTPLKACSIILEKLCVEFTVSGAVGHVKVDKTSRGTWMFDMGTVTAELKILEACFGEETIELEKIDEPERKGIRLILCAGENRTLDFSRLEQAYMLYALEISDRKSQSWFDEEPPVGTCKNGREVWMSMCRENGETDEICVPVKPEQYIKPHPGLQKMFKNGGFFYYEEGLL